MYANAYIASIYNLTKRLQIGHCMNVEYACYICVEIYIRSIYIDSIYKLIG